MFVNSMFANLVVILCLKSLPNQAPRPSEYWIMMKRLATNKRSIVSVRGIGDKEKKFYNIASSNGLAIKAVENWRWRAEKDLFKIWTFCCFNNENLLKNGKLVTIFFTKLLNMSLSYIFNLENSFNSINFISWDK